MYFPAVNQNVYPFSTLWAIKNHILKFFKWNILQTGNTGHFCSAKYTDNINAQLKIKYF